MKNCCIKWSEAKNITPSILKKITDDTKAFFQDESRVAVDDLIGDKRRVVVTDVRNVAWLVDLGLLYTEMNRIRKEAEKGIGILATGLNTYILITSKFGCETACVGGGELMFYLPFILSLRSEEVRFVYAHELYHTYQHIPERIIPWAINNNFDIETLTENLRGEKTMTEASIMKWYTKWHNRINIAADYEDNYILEKTGLIDEDFLTGGDPAHPRFCYNVYYGQKPFEDVFAILGTEKDETIYAPKKTIINGPVIITDDDDIESADIDGSNGSADVDDSDGGDGGDTKTSSDRETGDGTEVINGPVTAKVGGGSSSNGGEVEVNGEITDKRKNKNNMPGSSGSGEGDSLDGGGGDNNGKKDPIGEATNAAKAIAEWVANRSGVAKWEGGKFTGEIKNALSQEEIKSIMKKIVGVFNVATKDRVESALRNGVDAIIASKIKSAQWGNRNHIWKKEVRARSTSRTQEAKINLILLFDNSGSMGAPLINSCIDCIITIWKEYEEVINKVVLIPMRERLHHDKRDVIIIESLEHVSSAKKAINDIAGDDNNESFNTACAALSDRKIINPDDYNVFLNTGDRAWAGSSETVDNVCKVIRLYCANNGFDMKDMFISLQICTTVLRSEIKSDLDSTFAKWGVTTIKIGYDDMSH